VYDVKADGTRKARLVADGHLTPDPGKSTYSSVVSLRGVRIVIFIAEMNGLEVWVTDIGNAYIQSYTKEKLYVIAGPEFGELEGCILIVSKALYGLKTSGVRWHERFSDVLREMGFFPSKAEDDIWMRLKGDHYEYVARYVDDLIIASKEPKAFMDALTGTYKFKLKGVGPITYHLGLDYFRDSNNVLCASPKKYLERMSDTYVRLIGDKPRLTYYSPLEHGDHPELDTSDELGPSDIRIFQTLIGVLQWTVSLGRWDIAAAVMTMSKFRAAPRQGHLDRVKRIFGYLLKMKEACIRFRTDKPDLSAETVPSFDWAKSIYGEVHEEIPEDRPKPLGKSVVHIVYKDANLLHDLTTGRAVTGIIHILNKTPIDCYSKRQATVETATYGSEFVAAKTAVEQIMDVRLTLMYLGVPIDGPTYLYGDNKTVVTSSLMPHSKLHKRHTALAYHRVREAIASGMVVFIHIIGKLNPADFLSKCWGYSQVWTVLQPLFFWEGDTSELIKEEG